MGHAIDFKKEKSNFLKFTSPTESSRGTNHTSTLEKPEDLATETNKFSVLEKKDSTTSSNFSEAKEKSIQGRKPEDPTHPVEAPSIPELQHIMTSPPSPDEEEGEVTPSDADIPDSIARALLDAL